MLQRADISREFVTTIVTRQIRFLGHILRTEKLEELVLTGHTEGKQARGRQRLTFHGLAAQNNWCKTVRTHHYAEG